MYRKGDRLLFLEGKGSFLYGVRPYPPECYIGNVQEKISSQWQGLTPTSEKVAYPLYKMPIK